MVSIGNRTLEVVNLHNAGVSVQEIAKYLGISTSNVEKRLRAYDRFRNGSRKKIARDEVKVIIKSKSNLGIYTWETEKIKEGFDRFIGLHGRLPTADEVDELDYLPSSRQIQRRYGGLAILREQLGYEDVHFGRGDHRSRIQKSSRTRGNEAELKMYKWLVRHFGEPFVHSEKEYGDIRNRVDFLIYAKNHTFGIDVFATDTIRTLRKNVDIKAKKYTRFPPNLPLYFIAWGGKFSQDEIDITCRTHLKSLENLRIYSATTAFEELSKIESLPIPQGYVTMNRKL